MVSISTKGLRLIEAVAPTSEAIYAEITEPLRRAQARRTAGHARACWNAALQPWKWRTRKVAEAEE